MRINPALKILKPNIQSQKDHSHSLLVYEREIHYYPILFSLKTKQIILQQNHNERNNVHQKLSIIQLTLEDSKGSILLLSSKNL